MRGEEGPVFLPMKSKKKFAVSLREAALTDRGGDKMRLEKRKLSELKPAEYNPRKALKPGDPEYEKLAASIEKHGYIDPIIINEDGTIIGGHQRRTVMLDLGYEEAEVIIVNLPDKNDEIAANIALNQISGEFEKDALMGLLIQLEGAGYDTMAAGFNTQDLSALFAEVDLTQEADDDHYDIEKAEQQAEEREPVTQPGDIWQMGEHRLMCGDASDASDVGILMAGCEADLILTDPPYNVDYEAKDKALEYSYKRNTTRTNNEITNDRMEEGAGHYFIDDRSQDTVFIEDDIDFKAMKKDDLVAYIEQIREALMARTSVQFEKKPARSDMHPTMKPVSLVGRFMANSSRRGELVADFFGGSGTTLIAAEQLGRVAYLMEISPKYCDIIINRWEEYTGKKAVRVRGGGTYGG